MKVRVIANYYGLDHLSLGQVYEVVEVWAHKGVRIKTDKEGDYAPMLWEEVEVINEEVTQMTKEVGQKYKVIDHDCEYDYGTILTLIKLCGDNISKYIDDNGRTEYMYDYDHDRAEIEPYVDTTPMVGDVVRVIVRESELYEGNWYQVVGLTPEVISVRAEYGETYNLAYEHVDLTDIRRSTKVEV